MDKTKSYEIFKYDLVEAFKSVKAKGLKLLYMEMICLQLDFMIHVILMPRYY